MITIKIAGLPIAVDNKYPRMEEIARDYLTDEEPLFTVSATKDELDEERRVSGTDFSDGYYETIVVYRNIARKLPDYDAFLFHGAVLESDNGAYAFTAHSGVGKTTHVNLWLKAFPDISVLNGDKPIVRLIDGVPYACGTPWMGKEGMGKNSIKPLLGIAFLQRGQVNIAYPIEASDAVIRFMRQAYLPRANQLTLLKTMKLADKVLSTVKLVHLECNMDPDAAAVCRRAFEA